MDSTTHRRLKNGYVVLVALHYKVLCLQTWEKNSILDGLQISQGRCEQHI